MVKNSYTIYIEGINYTHYAVVPFKWGDFLDERLDEAYVTLKGVRREVFAPLTTVEVVLDNKVDGGYRKQLVKQYVVANDENSETQIGSGLYNHNLYLIELTKAAECVVVDTITFTNDLGRTYAGPDTPLAEPVWES